MLKKVVEVGEQKISQFAAQMMSNDKVVEGAQEILKTALAARAQVVATAKTVLKTIGVPTLDDLKRIDDKLSEIETLFTDIRSALRKDH